MERRSVLAIVAATVAALSGLFWWLWPFTSDSRTETRPAEPDTRETPTATETGTETAPEPGALIRDPDNPQWLRYRNGEHVFLCGAGSPEEFLYRGEQQSDGTRDGDQEQLVRKMAEYGGNVLYFQLVRSHGGDGKPSHNPWVDNDPSKGLNAAVLDQWERWLTLMEEHGIVAYVQVYDDGTRIWDSGTEVTDAEETFFREVVTRFRHHDNLIWLVGEEIDEAYSETRVQRLAELIATADGRGHMVGTHHLNGVKFTYYERESALDHFGMQYNVGTEKVHGGALEARRRALQAPGDGYQLMYVESTASQGNGVDDIRHYNWNIAMAGVMPLRLRMDVDETPPPALEQCRILRSFFESTDVWGMQNHDELATAGTTYVLADPVYPSFIAYADGTSGSSPLGLQEVPGGTYVLRWVDCVTGNTAMQRCVRTETGSQTFERPDGIGDQCAVWLTQDGVTEDGGCQTATES